MISSKPDRLTQFALNTLEEVVAEASAKSKAGDRTPMKRTWGIRLALTYLASRGVGERRLHETIWDELVDTHESQGDSTACYIRFTSLNTAVGRFYTLLKIPRTAVPTIGTKRRGDDQRAEHERIWAETQAKRAAESAGKD